MHSTTRLALATVSLIGTVAGVAFTPASATAGPESVRERGVVLVCTGTLKERQVVVEVYENDTYGNSVSVVIGDPDAGGVHGSRSTTTSLWAGRRVEATVRVQGRRAAVTGVARKTGPRIAVHDEFDDAGQHIVADGFHRRLRTDLTLTYRKSRVPLTCAPAFRYDVQVTKEDVG
ncbi:hypothetical protein [Nocardioides lianchengensis]|uniref:Secreted protein n=1 Tax=Nocardioides lianchengensis TaxID=1045774 RepID=A0A1G7BA34_9ACTN|nr:hypothetical protein [Nocardioides lianchengensis]NYG10050.1 hypothetical protein [Nocardioides lianchengensis]SDE23988.1 hypothetical protein SAMN05421872_11798 [Nocardioides lianchengensis]